MVIRKILTEFHYYYLQIPSNCLHKMHNSHCSTPRRDSGYSWSLCDNRCRSVPMEDGGHHLCNVLSVKIEITGWNQSVVTNYCGIVTEVIATFLTVIALGILLRVTLALNFTMDKHLVVKCKTQACHLPGALGALLSGVHFPLIHQEPFEQLVPSIALSSGSVLHLLSL